MQKNLKLKIAGSAAAAAAVLGGGGALAATQLSPTEESDAIVADVAKQLGVDADELDAALKQALENRIDAAVEAGRLTEAQGTEMKERIAAGEVPLVGVGPARGHHFGHRGFADLEEAASYLGLTEAALRESLQDGDTLAEIAQANGKTAAGLVDALVAAAKADLGEKVEDGSLTEAERTSILADVESRIEDLVNGELRFGFRGGHGGFGGPPPSQAPDA
jgi:transposase-like protein